MLPLGCPLDNVSSAHQDPKFCMAHSSSLPLEGLYWDYKGSLALGTHRALIIY